MMIRAFMTDPAPKQGFPWDAETHFYLPTHRHAIATFMGPPEKVWSDYKDWAQKKEASDPEFDWGMMEVDVIEDHQIQTPKVK